MQVLKDNLVEVAVLIGIGFVSAGLFLLSAFWGCFGTGLMFWGLAFLIWENGGE